MKTIEELEREIGRKQEKINRAVRDLDRIAYLLARPLTESALIREDVLQTQARLREGR